MKGIKGFQKGNTDGKKGRGKGTKNKKTEQWEQFTKFCMEGGLKKFEEELNALAGKDYINAFLQLLEFHKPKLARSIMTDEDVEQLKSITFMTYEDIQRLNGTSGGNGSLHKEPSESSRNGS